MTNKQKRRAARHMKRLQGWMEFQIRVWRRYERRDGSPFLYNSYAVWRSVSKHLRNRILRFKNDE